MAEAGGDAGVEEVKDPCGEDDLRRLKLIHKRSYSMNIFQCVIYTLIHCLICTYSKSQAYLSVLEFDAGPLEILGRFRLVLLVGIEEAAGGVLAGVEVGAGHGVVGVVAAAAAAAGRQSVVSGSSRVRGGGSGSAGGGGSA